MRDLGNILIRQASKLKYRVEDVAPSTALDLFNGPKTLVIWSGASENTIWSQKETNWAFRALHDALHIETGIGFTPQEEIYLGRIQASHYEGIMADLVYIETAGQAEHYLKTGQFVENQIEFTMRQLKKLGVSL